MRYVFLSAESSVVQVIIGDLDPTQRAAFLRDYAVLFGAKSVVEVADDAIPVWIGGSYDSSSGEFLPPPSPEPEPEIVEETINDDAPIE